MSNKNVHGLSRHIPAEVAREVRKRCGFGCVVCGSAIVDYEHFDPAFKDAKSHDPDGIILLCPTHHRAKGGMIARSTIKEAASAPFCLQSSFAWAQLDLQNATTRVGPFMAVGCEVVLEICGEPVIWFNPPEVEGAPNRFNLILRDEDGSELVRIVDNVWHASSSAADVRLTAGDPSSRLEVRDQNGPVFKATVRPPAAITIELYKSWSRGRHYELKCNPWGRSTLIINGQLVMDGPQIGLGAFQCRTAAAIA